MSAFFVTGTDTNVGKTVASRAIMQAMQEAGIEIVGFKPLACGQDDSDNPYFESPELNEQQLENNRDVLVLKDSTNQDVSYQDINSYTFLHTMPTLMEEGKRIQLDKINQDLKRLTSKYESVLVEGTFGWSSPLTQGKLFADWVAEQKMPVVLVVGIKEGCINHALLTAQAIQAMGLPLLGWVANRINPGLGHYAAIIDEITKHIDAPLLGRIPYVYKPEERQLGRYITGIDRLSFMQTVQAK